MAGWPTVENEFYLHDVEIKQINYFDSGDGGKDCELHDIVIKQMNDFDSRDGGNDCELHDIVIKQMNDLYSRDGGNDCELCDVEIKQINDFDSRDGGNDCELYDVEIKRIYKFDLGDGGNDCELNDIEIKQTNDFDLGDGGNDCELHDIEIKHINDFDSGDEGNDCELHDVVIKQITDFNSCDGGNDRDLYDVEIKQMPNLDLHVKYDSSHVCVERLKALFDEISENKNGKRPIPALLNDGQPLDLFKIFWAVWIKGGYDFVSENGLWASVAKDCKIDSRKFEESIKSVYLKYVSELDCTLRDAINSKCLEKGKGKNGKIGLLLSELQEFSGCLRKEGCVKRKNGQVSVFEQKIDGKFYDADIEYADELLDIVETSEKNINNDENKTFGAFEGELNCKKRKQKEGCSKKENGQVAIFEQNNNGIYHDADIEYVDEVCDIVENSQKTIEGISEFKKRKLEEQCAKKKNGLYCDVDIVYLDKECDIVEKGQKTSNDDNDEKNCLVDGESDSKNRKENSISLSGMLNWVVEVAKHPDSLNWKDHKRYDFRAQALLARQALLRMKTTEDSQKKLKMHPLMYEDKNNLTPQSAEKLRSSERVNLKTKSRISPCCSSSTLVKIKDNPKEKAHPDIEILETNGIDFSSEEVNAKNVFVGPFFQAEVPEWTGVVFESDSKWLGTLMWPPQNGKHFSNLEINSIGNGRKELCLCRYPGSVACVRFHIAENRMKLRREIGLLFYHWKFHLMGEEVSLSWTIEEENRFKSMARSQSWDDTLMFFSDKTKEKLVSYYFNVFLIGRRAYQNRVTPKDIDSDDEDASEFGCVGGRFGNESPNFRGSNGFICAENKQHIDF